MTLPNQFFFPQLPSEDEPEKIYQYLKEQRFELNQMYEQMAFNINGSIRSYAETGPDTWTPTLSGSTVAGSFEPYTRQVGWSIRQGIFTELWFDIVWTTTTATGNLLLELPYKVTITDGLPFIGAILTSTITYAGDTAVIGAVSNSYTGSFIYYGSGIAANNISVQTSGRVAGNLRYIGVEDE